MTRSRYPGNPDFHPIPPRCSTCGRFVGSPVFWRAVNPYDDLPVWYEALCPEHSPELPEFEEVV